MEAYFCLARLESFLLDQLALADLGLNHARRLKGGIEAMGAGKLVLSIDLWSTRPLQVPSNWSCLPLAEAFNAASQAWDSDCSTVPITS